MTDTAVAQEPKAAPKTDESVGTEPVEKSMDDVLNEFTAEYDADAQAPEQIKADPPKSDESETLRLLKSLDQREKAREQQEDTADLSAAVKLVKDSGLGIPSDLIEAAFHIEARKDKRFLDAFNQRKQNPEGWIRVAKAFGKKLAGKIEPQPDAQLTSDREAARDAVRGSSTETPSETEMTNERLNPMSNVEFDAEMRKHGYSK